MPVKNPTVYSTVTGRICPECGKPIANCACHKPQAPRGDGIVRVQLDSKRRKGKIVTLISGVPLEGEKLHSLLSDLKRMCGSGGTFKDGILEIQGDHRDTVFDALKKQGFTVKKAGG